MTAPFLIVRGYKPAGRVIWFISEIRSFTGADLLTAKNLKDKLETGQTLELKPTKAEEARIFGEALLRSGVPTEVELIECEGQAATLILLPPSQPPATCPDCHCPLVHHKECGNCGWLRFPGDRKRWTTHGPCPRCGFSYRWDGSICSHCGNGST